MAASLAPPSSLISRVLSPLSISNGGNSGLIGSRLPVGPALRFTPLTVAFARRNRKNTSLTPRKEAPPKIKKSLPEDGGEEDDIDEDAIEALFSQLEEDLKNDLSGDEFGDDEITEEDLAKLEQELEEALGDIEIDDPPGGFPSSSNSMDLDEESDDDEEEEERPKLKNWQIKRLAHALKIGRRKTSIKSLAAELGLDRAFVLELLRDPPPYLLLKSAQLPDKITQTTSEIESEIVETPLILAEDVPKIKPEVKEPVHVMQTRWCMQKRLKKVQIETLERVYMRTKRPTNAMINSIVHVTNLPWKRVVKWFEDKRHEDGVPDQRVPFRRPTPETISS